MELWLTYAVISSIFIWINSFFIKIFSEKGFDGSILSIFQGVTYMVLGCIYALTVDSDFMLEWKYILLLLALLIIILYFINIRIRVEILKYLSSSEYFVSYRIASTWFLILLWIFIFGEIISASQWFWLIIWSIGILFLFEEDTRLRKWHSWHKSILLLIISIITWVLIQVMNKYITITENIFPAVLFYQWVFTIILFGMLERKRITHSIKKTPLKQVWLVVMIATLTSYFATVFNFLSYTSGWNLSVVTKINAYALFIPIILSMIFYDEKMSYKKWIAFVLTIISIYYLN